MGSYLVRRLLQVIPILFGVILLTFVLFHGIGGSPAAVVLGKNANPQALEEFDRRHGFDRPLLGGWWARSRAFEDADSRSGRPVWIREGERSRWPIPLRFTPPAGESYRWTLRYRLDPGAEAFFVSSAGTQSLPRAAGSVRLDVNSPADSEIRVSGGAMDVRSLRLRRRMSHFLDSQFFLYLRQLLSGDFGTSYETNQKVLSMLKEGVGPSLFLSIPIFVGGLGVSLVLALVCANFRDRALDRWLVIGSTALMSVNYIVWVIAGQYVFAFKLGWFPVWGFESWRYLLLPVLVGIVSGLGRDVRFYRTLLLDEMYKDYVRTAVAKGVSPSGVLFRHVLRNALIPVITNVSMTLPFLFTGSLLLESFYGIPGLGNLSINAINSSDMDVVRAVVLIGALLYVLVNIAADLCYAWADPRIRVNREP